MTTLAELNAMDREDLAALLSGAPETVLSTLQVAAEGGSAEAQLRLGQMRLEGLGGAERNVMDALAWFGKAAQAGHPMGMNMVGRCIEHGWGTLIDKAQAALWYRAAAERGLDWGQYNLATLLALGDGVSCDLHQALALFRKAAEQGHAKSINMIGSFYEDGWAVERDRAIAARHYRRAAELGDFRGQFNHARILVEDGRIDEALIWLARVPETATARFMEQMRGWFMQQSDPRLAALAADSALPD
ncbi:tetratricopeptide repeat protein [Novosphingobium sp. 9]|uniref:tetratricopeptide repeat protein n=1 Tax=Novosphingobium sp. 9 TaxID=2025349 RepID=UPI0021B6E4D7|nr:tetratricopeptide repeat protein [Novosphingobium sp. 9]